jgi:hypothetical protein
MSVSVPRQDQPLPAGAGRHAQAVRVLEERGNHLEVLEVILRLVHQLDEGLGNRPQRS